MAIDPKEMDAFNAAMTGLRTQMFGLGLHAPSFISDDPDSLRKLAKDVLDMSRAFDKLVEASGVLCGVEASWNSAAAVTAAEDYCPALEGQAHELEDDEAERVTQGRWERQHRQVYDPPRD